MISIFPYQFLLHMIYFHKIIQAQKSLNVYNEFSLSLFSCKLAIRDGVNSDVVPYTVTTVTVFFVIKPTRCTNFPNLFLSRNSTCFGQFLCPSSGVFHCIFGTGICHTGFKTAFEQEHMLLLDSCLQTCMTYTSAECTVENS